MRSQSKITAPGAPQAPISPNLDAVFVSHAAFEARGWGAMHPLAIPRHAAVVRICAALGWLDDDHFFVGRAASVDELVRFHDPGYVEAFRAADARGQVSVAERARYALGTMENPLFPGVFERASASVGCSIVAAERALEGRIAYHPAGGTHHGRRDRASGFCYFNDPAFAVDVFVRAGATPVLYLDFDAHHGDGVQDFFADSADVHTLSIHEEARWPHTGAADDRGGGNARNFPVPRGFNDCELDFVMAEAVAPFAAEIAPKAVVITSGADALGPDPLSGLALSNGALWRAVEASARFAPSAVVLGGGGYNPWTVARAWAGLWGRLAGLAFPEVLPEAARAVLEGLESNLVDEDEVEPYWLDRLTDPPNEGPVRDAVRALVDQVCAPR